MPELGLSLPFERECTGVVMVSMRWHHWLKLKRTHKPGLLACKISDPTRQNVRLVWGSDDFQLRSMHGFA